jgi:hypothetical protein
LDLAAHLFAALSNHPDLLPVKGYPAGALVFKTDNTLCHGGFAASAFAHDTKYFAPFAIETRIVNRPKTPFFSRVNLCEVIYHYQDFFTGAAYMQVLKIILNGLFFKIGEKTLGPSFRSDFHERRCLPATLFLHKFTARRKNAGGFQVSQIG